MLFRFLKSIAMKEKAISWGVDMHYNRYMTGLGEGKPGHLGGNTK